MQLGRVELVDIVVEPIAGGAALAESAHGVGAGDRLVGFAQQIAGAFAHRQDPSLLFTLQGDEHRHHQDEHGDGHERELPRVDEHRDRRGERDAGVDQPGVGAPVDEPREGFDVAGGARDEVALSFDGVLLEREIDGSAQHDTPEVGEGALRGANQEDLAGDGERADRNDDRQGDQRQRRQAAPVEPGFGQQVVVDELLEQHRDGDPPEAEQDTRADQQADHRLELGTEFEAPANDGHRVDLWVAGLGHGAPPTTSEAS